MAEAYIKQLSDAKVFASPIVTTLEPLEQFFEAEDYHQNFVARNPGQPYVAAVAVPKVKKLEKAFARQAEKGDIIRELHAVVAQLDRASAFEAEGHRFEPCRPHILTSTISPWPRAGLRPTGPI